MQDPNLISEKVQIRIKQLLQKKFELQICTLDISKATAPGDNFLGVISKVQVNGSGKTLHLIVKCAPKNEIFRRHTSIRKAYLREIFVYTDIFPEILKFQKQRSIVNGFNSYAICYEVIKDEMDEALIMENMEVLDFVVPKRSSTLDYNHAVLVMKEYGRMHAVSFALRDQNPKLFKKLAENMEDELFQISTSGGDLESLENGLKATTERGLRALDPVGDADAYERFKTYHERGNKLVEVAVSSRAAGEYAVFGHGDAWLNNILFKYEHPHLRCNPTALCFLDWQFARLGSPVLDISYFLFTCLSEETRTDHYDHLIQEYYNSLCVFVRELGSDPEQLFPYDVFKEHLRKFSVYGLHMALVILYLIVSDPEEIPDLHTSSSEEETMEKFQYETKNVQKYYDRFRPVVKDFVKYNYEF